MRVVLAVVASAALALLVGCGSASPPADVPKLLTRAEAEARTVVPFTRGVRLDKAGRIVDVTFEAPAVVDPQMSWLKLGLKCRGLSRRLYRKLLNASGARSFRRVFTWSAWTWQSRRPYRFQGRPMMAAAGKGFLRMAASNVCSKTAWTPIPWCRPGSSRRICSMRFCRSPMQV